MPIGDIEDLRTFVCIVDKQGLSAAGRALNTPKSSISRRLAGLEQRLGAKLLNRTSRNLQLTDTGRTIYEHATRILDEVALIADAVGSDEPRGLLRIASTFTLAHTLLAPIIGDFVKQFPRVDVEIEAASRLQDLVRDDFDVAVRGGSLRGGAYVAKRLSHVQLGLFATPAYLESRGVTADEPMLGRDNLVGLTAHASTNAAARGAEATRRARISANDPSLLKSIVLSGGGLSWLPFYLVRQEVADGRLVRCLPDRMLDGPEVYAIYADRKNLPHKTRVFLDHLVKHVPAALDSSD